LLSGAAVPMRQRFFYAAVAFLGELFYNEADKREKEYWL
jgi:hypothetical protein